MCKESRVRVWPQPHSWMFWYTNGNAGYVLFQKQEPWYWMKFTHSISMSSPADCVLVLKLLHSCCFGMTTFDCEQVSSCVDWSSVFWNWTEQNVLLHLCFITAGKIRNPTTKKEKAPRRTKADVSQKKIPHRDGVGTGCTNRPSQSAECCLMHTAARSNVVVVQQSGPRTAHFVRLSFTYLPPLL